jgi:hypothetical protein
VVLAERFGFSLALEPAELEASYVFMLEPRQPQLAVPYPSQADTALKAQVEMC